MKNKKRKDLTGIRAFLDRRNLVVYPISFYNVFRGFTKWIRINPTFIIIGAGRCGTTALYDYLTKNKDGFEAATKEIHFFDEYFDKGINWFRGNFPSVFQKFYLQNLLHKKIIVGEATASYLHNPLVAKRISSIFPNLKLIVMLRNPIDRAFSHYKKRYDKGAESLSFEDVIKKELKHLKEKSENESSEEIPSCYLEYPYISRGFYYEQLKIWEKYFPESQILIIKSEDFFNEPHVVLERVYKFLGKRNMNLKDLSNLKINKNASKYNVKLDENLRTELMNFYKSHNEKLKKWDIDFFEE